MSEVTYKFEDLTERAKQHAREKFGESNLEYEWWDDVYKDAIRMGAIIGIEIATTARALKSGRTVHDPELYFSGFSSQGDGASFAGSYYHKPEAGLTIRRETIDPELIRIADELTILQLTRRLVGLEPFSANVTTSGRYSHSNTMAAEVITDYDGDAGHDEEENLEADVTGLMRDFADWIYKQLEAEHDWLVSDECIDGYLEQDEFDEDGNVI